MLHVIAGVAIVTSGAMGMSMPRPARDAMSSSREDAAISMQVLDADIVPTATPMYGEGVTPHSDLAALPFGGAISAVAEPTVAIGDANVRNAAAPAVPDTPLAVRTYVVEPGDSVRTIAQQFKVTNETIIWENDLTDPDILQVGQQLEILPFSGLIHEVRPGDTVASVANSYDALVAAVIAANRLSDPYVIVVGQKLAVPGGYRSLPQKVIVAPPGPGDTVQAPPGDDDQQAAIVTPKHRLPTLGGTPQEQFIASIAEAAVQSADDTGVPASVTIAQAILESYWGSSRLAQEANNYFGIKAQARGGSAGSIWFDVWEVIGGRSVMQSQAFRAYNTIAESFVDHGRFFVENARYGAAMAAKNDAQQFAREVNRAGYATDPAYASKLIGLMNRYDLYRYDDV
jgi:flagellum-specific peptidoglycan hydrolase FlgJ